MERPNIKPHDWITIGTRHAVVSNIIEESDDKIKVEIVYLDDKNKAINENVIWKNNKWEFEYNTPTGGYADKYTRLNEFVGQLRRGRYPK